MTNHSRLGTRLAAFWLLPALIVLLSVGPSVAQKERDGKLTFEVYKDKAGEYRWRLKAANSKILAVPEDAYKNHADAKKAIESIRDHVAKMKTEYYQDKAKEYRWRLKATNGRVMARSSEGYKEKKSAQSAVALVRSGVKSATVVEKK